MSTFRVVLDGQDIYDPTQKDLVLYNAVVKTEAGAAGSFDFTMPPGHVFYGKVTPYGSTIEVFEDGESIFYGRPLRPKIGFYNQATYHCEGALAFLNDIHGPEFIYEDIMVQNYFRNLISTHNAGEQAKQERRFTVGNVTVIDNVAVYRETSPSSTIFDLIKKGCIGTSGGYLFTRRVNGVTYIDWVADMPYTCNQTVEFAINLIDMARSGDDDIYTGVMLKGGKPDDAPEGAGAVTAGPIWMSAEIQAKYGNMCAYLEFPDIKTSAGLIEKGDEFLQKQQFESMCFEVTAAEQHYLNVSLDAFKAGQMVYLISHPHFVQMQLPVQSVEYNLNSGAKKITLGTAKKQTLTKIERRIRDNTNAMQENLEQQREDLDKIIPEVQDMIDNSGIVPGDDGNNYAIGVDPNGDVYATKVPSRIYITHPPDKTTYQQGETYDWTGLIVMAEYGDGTTEDVTSRCGIAPEDGTTVTDENGNHQGTVALIVGRGGLEDYFDYVVGYLPSGDIIINDKEYKLDDWSVIEFSSIPGVQIVTGRNYTITRITEIMTGQPEEDTTSLYRSYKVTYTYKAGQTQRTNTKWVYGRVRRQTDVSPNITLWATYEEAGTTRETNISSGAITATDYTVIYNGETTTLTLYSNSLEINDTTPEIDYEGGTRIEGDILAAYFAVGFGSGAGT